MICLSFYIKNNNKTTIIVIIIKNCIFIYCVNKIKTMTDGWNDDDDNLFILILNYQKKINLSKKYIYIQKLNKLIKMRKAHSKFTKTFTKIKKRNIE